MLFVHQVILYSLCLSSSNSRIRYECEKKNATSYSRMVEKFVRPEQQKTLYIDQQKKKSSSNTMMRAHSI